jgi:hypothetical protein
MLFVFCFSSHFVSVFILNNLSFPFQVNLCEIQPTIVKIENIVIIKSIVIFIIIIIIIVIIIGIVTVITIVIIMI